MRILLASSLLFVAIPLGASDKNFDIGFAYRNFDSHVFGSADEQGGMVVGQLEFGRDLGLVRAGPDQAAVRAGAHGQAQCVQQDRLAGAGFAGQHAQGSGEVEVEPVNQNDVADREAA